MQLHECPCCRLVAVNPQPSPADIAACYTHEYFNGMHDFYKWKDYRDVTRWMIEAGDGPGVSRFFENVPVRGKRLLEVGCGYGGFLVLARNAGATVTGVEISEHAAALAREEHGLNVLTGTLQDAALPSGTFDVVTFFDVVEHVPDPASFIAAVSRLLAPDGVLFCLVPNLDRTKVEGSDWPGLRCHPEHLYYFRFETFRRMLLDAGLEVRQRWTEGVGKMPAQAPEQPAATSRGREALKKIPGAVPFVRLGRRVASHNWIEAARARRYLGHNLIVLATKTNAC